MTYEQHKNELAKRISVIIEDECRAWIDNHYCNSPYVPSSRWQERAQAVKDQAAKDARAIRRCLGGKANCEDCRMKGRCAPLFYAVDPLFEVHFRLGLGMRHKRPYWTPQEPILPPRKLKRRKHSGTAPTERENPADKEKEGE